MRITILALALAALSCQAEVATEAPDDTDTVTLQEAMASIGAADVELFGHSIGRAAPGIPPFTDNELAGDVWDEVAEAVKQHYDWHVDDRFTVHALPDGVERITEGPNLDDPIVYEG